MIAALVLAATLSVPFEFAGDEIFVPVQVNGSEPMWFAVDSAASAMVLDSAVAGRLGLTGEKGEGHGAGAGPVAHVKLGRVSLRVGDLPVAPYTMIAIDLRGPAKSVGHVMDGLIGYEFFSKYAVAIDYRKHRLTMTTPDEFRAPKNYTALPLVIDHKLPFVEAEIKVPGVAAAKGRFLIDSGSADAVDHPLIRQSKGEVRKTLTGNGLGSPIEGYIGRAEYFKLGPYFV